MWHYNDELGDGRLVSWQLSVVYVADGGYKNLARLDAFTHETIRLLSGME